MKTAEEIAKKLVDWFLTVDIPNKNDALEARIEEALNAFVEEQLKQRYSDLWGIEKRARAEALEQAAKVAHRLNPKQTNFESEIEMAIRALNDKP